MRLGSEIFGQEGWSGNKMIRNPNNNKAVEMMNQHFTQ